MPPEWLAANIEKLFVIFPIYLKSAIYEISAKEWGALNQTLQSSTVSSPNASIRRSIAAKSCISLKMLVSYLFNADDGVQSTARSAYEVRPELAAEKGQQGLVPYHGVYLAPGDSQTLATLERAAGAPLRCSNVGYQFPVEEGGTQPAEWGGNFKSKDGRVVKLAFGSKFQILSVIREVGQLSGLKELALDIPENATYPAELGHLSALERLNLRRRKLTRVPGIVQELRSLHSLDLGQNQLTDLPDFLPRLPLMVLDLSENDLGGPLPILGEISSLTIFRLGGNSTKSILDRESDFIRSLSRLSNLRILGAGSIGLNREIPPEIARWS